MNIAICDDSMVYIDDIYGKLKVFLPSDTVYHFFDSGYSFFQRILSRIIYFWIYKCQAWMVLN